MRAALASIACTLCVGCSTPDSSARTVVTGPDRAQFDLVQPVLDRSCGTLDCHGARYRNLKVYGYDGLRNLPGDVPGGTPTTVAEVDATYASVVRLEAELMNAVVADHGANPQRLTLVRKARGTEQHAGGAVFALGGSGDRCLTTWLSSATDSQACNLALSAP